jgi:hypothetical protein
MLAVRGRGYFNDSDVAEVTKLALRPRMTQSGHWESLGGAATPFSCLQRRFR